MSEHTKEPWQQEPQDGHLVFDADHGVIADCDSPDDARRIVACVNACADLTTEFLEAQDLSFAPAHTAAKMTEIELERDRLLAALKYCRDVFDGYVSIHLDKTPPDYEKAARNEKCRAVCDAAIAAVERLQGAT